MKLLLDTSVLGRLCHPAAQGNRAVVEWVREGRAAGHEIILPEIADF